MYKYYTCIFIWLLLCCRTMAWNRSGSMPSRCKKLIQALFSSYAHEV